MGKPPVAGFNANPQNINTKGRPPKGYSITEAFQNMLGAEPETKAAIVQSIKDKALGGDTTAQKMIWNYMDGMPQQGVELSGTGENGAISIEIKMI